MLDRIPYRQFREWQNFANLIGPIGIQRTDEQFARMTALIYNRSRGRRERALSWKDFMPDWNPITYAERMRRSTSKMKAWKHQHSPEVRKMRKRSKGKKGDKS